MVDLVCESQEERKYPWTFINKGLKIRQVKYKEASWLQIIK